jgi:DNA-binding NarL/FixJ family response regulator
VATSTIRVLVVDDYEPWRRFFSSTLRKQPEYQVVGEVSDGLESVQQAEQLQPDLILLDIGLPTLNGIEAARRIREVSPASKILFVSENRSPDVVEAALSTGAGGYVVKSDAGNGLLPAVEAVLQGSRFVSASLAGHDLAHPTVDQAENAPQREKVVAPFRAQRNPRHEVEFYTDDAGFVDGFAHFIKAKLKAGNAIIVIATESHQADLLQRLTADGLNMPAEIEQGSYIPLEVTRTLSTFMVNNSPDVALFRKVAGDFITKAARGVKGENQQIAVCGEGVHTLLAAGNLDATITLERLWNEIGRHYELDMLCGYFRGDFATEEDISTLERVCAEHTAGRGLEPRS